MSASLRFKLLASFVLITSISLFIVGFVNYKLSRDKLISQLEDQAVSSVKHSAQNLYDFLSIRLAEVELISRVEVMKHGTLDEQLDFLRQELRTGGDRYYSMGVVDIDGNLSLTTGDKFPISDEKHFQIALTGHTAISDPYFSKRNKKYLISITVPVLDDNRKVVRIVDISLDATSTFRQHLIAPFNYGKSLIINEDGLMLYNTDPSLILSQNIFTEYQSAAPKLRSMLGKEAGFFDEAFGGSETRVFYTRVSEMEWYLAYTIPLAAFEAPTRSLLWTTTGLILLTVLVLSFFIYWVAHSLIIKRILQILRVTEAVADGDFYMKPLVYKNKDELGALAHSVNGMIENLRELFEPFEAFIHHNQYAMIVMDPEFTIMHFNKRAEDMLGYKLEEVVKRQTPLIWLDAEQLRDRAEGYSRELQEHIKADCSALVIKSVLNLPEDTEWIWHCKDGKRLYVESNVSIITHPDGSLKGYVCIARDISEIKESAATKERLMAIVENAHDVILTFDQEGYILYMNQTGRKYYGFEESPAKRSHFSQFVEIVSPVDFEQGLLLSIEQGFWEMEAEFQTRNKERIFISLIIVPHISPDRSDYYYSAITRDITDQKRSQEELVRAKQEADEANQAKSMFLARMSHEIRTPLNGIVGLTYLLERTVMTNLQQDYVQKIASSSRSLSKIITDILDFSKIEANKLAMERIAFQLDETIDRICDTLSVLLGNKPIEFVCDIDPQVPLALMGDPLRLYQILLNLTSNAVKFTDEGTITLKIEVQEETANGAMLTLSVIDTGIGIPAEQLARLFQPFAQADGSTSRKYGGTGLGLVISKNLIEQMGGTLDISSQAGIGSEFRATIPFGLGDSTGTPWKNVPFPLKALVVEDHSELRETLVSELSSICEEAAGVSSWDEAFRAADFIPLDLMLLDMEAPDMYGEEVWLELQSRCRDKQIRTILYTTLSGRDALGQLPQEARPDATLVKPVSPRALQQAIAGSKSPSGTSPSLGGTLAVRPENGQKQPHILLVEDNEINQTVARSLLESKGYSVHITNNGTDALHRLRNHAYSLILMDIHMPELDGIETTKQIRAMPEYALTPVIALTAASTNEQRQACMQAGMNDLVSKPIHPERLFLAIDRCLTGGSSEPDSAEAVGVIGAGVGGQSAADEDEEETSSLNAEQAILRFGGRTKLYQHILKQFHEQYADFAPRLRNLLALRQYAAALRELHTLRGTAGHISANRLFRAASRLERDIEGLNRSGASASNPDAETVADELERVFSAIADMNLP